MLFDADYAKNYASIMYQCLARGGGEVGEEGDTVTVRVSVVIAPRDVGLLSLTSLPN